MKAIDKIDCMNVMMLTQDKVKNAVESALTGFNASPCERLAVAVVLHEVAVAIEKAAYGDDSEAVWKYEGQLAEIYRAVMLDDEIDREPKGAEITEGGCMYKVDDTEYTCPDSLPGLYDEERERELAQIAEEVATEAKAQGWEKQPSARGETPRWIRVNVGETGQTGYICPFCGREVFHAGKKCPGCWNEIGEPVERGEGVTV